MTLPAGSERFEPPAGGEGSPSDRRARAGGTGSVVFLGPSLSLAEARSVLPLATYLPPVAQGDLLSIVTSSSAPSPWAVGIVDGVFYQSLPVWHKEILFALEAGVILFGASSMGALRAAECAPFGMIGVGEIFRRYAEGELEDDDEVAVAHEGEDEGWRARSEPLVNIRATLEAAVASGRLHNEVASAVIAAAKKLWFPERSTDRILQAAAARGLASTDLATVRDVLQGSYVDLKRSDARALLMAIARAAETDPAGEQAGPSRTVTLVRSPVFEALFERDRKIAHQQTPMLREDIARHAALSNPRFGKLRDRAVDRLLLAELAELWRVEVTPEDVEAETHRVRARLGLHDDSAFRSWQQENDLASDELDELMITEARLRKLRDWKGIAESKRLLVGAILTELKLGGGYEKEKQATAEYLCALTGLGERGPDPGHPGSNELIRDQIRAGGWRPELPIARFTEEAGFHDVDDLLEELARRWRVRQVHRRAVEVIDSLFGDHARRPEGTSGEHAPRGDR